MLRYKIEKMGTKIFTTSLYKSYRTMIWREVSQTMQGAGTVLYELSYLNDQTAHFFS
jgi:hypothetical protein